FQAEDGIRDLTVTGVQTCALPISQCALVQESSSLSRHPHALHLCRRFFCGSLCFGGRDLQRHCRRTFRARPYPRRLRSLLAAFASFWRIPCRHFAARLACRRQRILLPSPLSQPPRTLLPWRQRPAASTLPALHRLF